MNEAQSYIYRFGAFGVDAAKRLLVSRDGEAIPLTPKAFDTLLYLVEHPGTVLDKDELMQAIWPHTVVEENNLNQSISALRRALGESRGENRYITTVPGRGYCFVADVKKAAAVELTADSDSLNAASLPSRRIDRHKSRLLIILFCAVGVAGLGFSIYYFWPVVKTAISTAPDVATPIKPTMPVRSIAVLPFKPLVVDQRDESLEMGMADTLIVKLSNLRELIVRPISSVRKYSGLEQDALVAGRELRVEAVLDGQIQRWGDRISVTARLTAVGDGKPLWAGQFNEKSTDIFAAQNLISEKVTSALVLKLTGEEQRLLTKRHTENAEAYKLYQSGRLYWNKRAPEDLRKSIAHFQQAIALDPNYALAYAGLADAYALLANSGAPARELMLRAREAALKALSLDNDLAEAHTALAQILIYYDYNFVGAEREHKRAIELNPNYASAHQWYSELLTALSRHEEAFAEMRWALEIDPSSLIINRQYGVSLLFARQYDEAISQLKKTIEMDADFAPAHSTLSLAYQLKGNYAESVEKLAKYEELSGNQQSAALARESFARGGWQGFLRAMTGERQPSNWTPYKVATFHALLGEKDKAFAELNKSYQEHETVLGLLKVDPRFDSLRADPRFAEVLRRIGLAP
jgi:DNA-binding winged helix-turn-helix (wHTH) protein/TolB-like protein